MVKNTGSIFYAPYLTPVSVLISAHYILLNLVNIKTLLDAGTNLKLKYLLSASPKQGHSHKFLSVKIKNNIKIFNLLTFLILTATIWSNLPRLFCFFGWHSSGKRIKSKPAGVCKCFKGQFYNSITFNTGLLRVNSFKTPILKRKTIGLRQIHLTALQRLNAEDMAWLVGLVEGDGWFSITQNGKYCKYEFGIELHERDIQMLYKIKKALGVGTISLKKDQNKVSFRIRKKPHLKEVILPIFDKYPMISTKHLKYIRFRLNLLNNILYYENLMDYNPTDLTLYNNVDYLIKLDYFDNWLVGFIEAEGCFSKYKLTSLSLYNIVSFEVSQTNQLPLLMAIKKRLSITSNPYVDKTNNAKLKTTSLDSIQNVIKFLDKTSAKLKGHKRLQYLLFLKELRTNPKYIKLRVPKIYGKNTLI